MKIWIVSDRDYDNDWVVAVYPTEALANEHVALMGGSIDEQDIRDVLHPDATDPAKQRERAVEAERSRKNWQRQQEQQQRDAELRRQTKPNPPHMGLCHCDVFSKDRRFVNEHGYCGYCGGFTHKVFREHMGEAALQAAIDKLALHDRERMRQIAG